LHAKLSKFLVLGTALCLISGCSSGNGSSVASAVSKDKTIDVNGENSVGDLSFAMDLVTTTDKIEEMDPWRILLFHCTTLND
jgi:hypothetical protein